MTATFIGESSIFLAHNALPKEASFRSYSKMVAVTSMLIG